MRSHSPSSRTTGLAIKSASPHKGSWQAISVWQGTADTVVNPTNADAILQQWREVHNLSAEPDTEQLVNGYPHRAWCDGNGKPIVEEYRVTGMGHGTALACCGIGGYGNSGAFMLEVGISSTVQSAKSWDLLDNFNGVVAVDNATQHWERHCFLQRPNPPRPQDNTALTQLPAS